MSATCVRMSEMDVICRGRSYEMGHELFAVTGEKVDDRDFDHGIGSGLQAHGSAGSADVLLMLMLNSRRWF